MLFENKRQNLLYLLIVGFFLFILFELGYIFSAFLAFIAFYVILKPLHLRLLTKVKPGLSAAILILGVIGLIVTPCVFIISAIVPKVHMLLQPESHTLQFIREIGTKVGELLDVEDLEVTLVTFFKTNGAIIAEHLLGSLGSAFLNILLMFVFLFFGLVHHKALEETLMAMIPVRKDLVDRFSKELKGITIISAVGSPAIIVFQGLVACFGYWIIGLENPFFWGMITGIFTLVPVVGAAAVWGPLAFMAYLNGNPGALAGYIIVGVIVGFSDNVLRFIFMKKFADMHPIVSILGVLLGLPLFGVLGIIFGPLLISYFLLLIKIYKELYETEKIEEVKSDNGGQKV
jgi:predicted PurR-regulated permease PerM